MLACTFQPRLQPVLLTLLAIATPLFLYKTNDYCNQDHLHEGQHWSQALFQDVFLLLKKFLRLSPVERYPFLPEHITPTRLQYCLRHYKAASYSNVVVKSLTKTRIGGGNGLLGTVWQIHLKYDTSHNRPEGPSSVVLKLMNRGFRARLLARMGNIAATECFFYRDSMLQRVRGIRSPVCYFTGWRTGYQHFCLLLEDLTHLRTGSTLEREGLSHSNACSIVKQVARFHAHYFNTVRLKGPKWVGRPFDTTRYQHVPGYVKNNVNATFHRIQELEKSNIVPKGLLSKRIQTYVRELASKYLNNTAKNIPVELGGTHNRTIVLGDLRGGNIFVLSNNNNNSDDDDKEEQSENDEIILYDFQLCREGCPAEDIDWFLGSISIDVRQKHGKHIVRCYYDELIKNGVDEKKYPWHRLVYEIATYCSSKFWFVNLLEYRFLSKAEMYSNFLDCDTSNTAEDFDKVLHGLKLRWTREISMFEEFNSDKLAQLANECSPSSPTPEQYLPLLPQDWL
jgi:hypothetical protein